MINPLKIATRGYLKQTTKAVLIIAVAGYLSYETAIINKKSNEDDIEIAYRGNDENDLEKLNKNRLIEETEIITIVELVLKHFIV